MIHAKRMTRGSVNDARKSGRPTTSQSADNVAAVQEMFNNRSPQKPTGQAACESGLKHTVSTALHKELNYQPWKPHQVQGSNT